jgi:carbamate kinase
MRFESGSMAAKVGAACRFVAAPGGVATLGALCDTVALVRGEAETRVTPSRHRDDDGSSGT